MMKANERGRRGEEIAIDFFQRLGYTIIVHNYIVRGGEIDIIASYGDTLIFAEVKTRRSSYFMEAREAVDLRKQARIVKTAQRYLAESGWEGFCRFDVVEVYFVDPERPKITHLQNAFEA